MKYKFLPHTGDIKFRAFGSTLREVFENSVLATVEVLSKKEKIKTVKVKKSKIDGKDNESLLYNLLEEVIYLLDAENFIVSKAKIKLNETSKHADVEFYGDDSKKYKDLDSIKAVTYNEMFVKSLGKNKLVAQVVLDV
ncbi:archease [Candidatus Pacearchaeota archaeon]|nr:archease [Candidatus Pacearchaeota archaeon]